MKHGLAKIESTIIKHYLYITHTDNTKAQRQISDTSNLLKTTRNNHNNKRTNHR